MSNEAEEPDAGQDHQPPSPAPGRLAPAFGRPPRPPPPGRVLAAAEPPGPGPGCRPPSRPGSGPQPQPLTRPRQAAAGRRQARVGHPRGQGRAQVPEPGGRPTPQAGQPLPRRPTAPRPRGLRAPPAIALSPFPRPRRGDHTSPAVLLERGQGVAAPPPSGAPETPLPRGQFLPAAAGSAGMRLTGASSGASAPVGRPGRGLEVQDAEPPLRRAQEDTGSPRTGLHPPVEESAHQLGHRQGLSRGRPRCQDRLAGRSAARKKGPPGADVCGLPVAAGGMELDRNFTSGSSAARRLTRARLARAPRQVVGTAAE